MRNLKGKTYICIRPLPRIDRMIKKSWLILPLLLTLLSCSPSKYVPEGHYLLDRTKIVTDKGLPSRSVLKTYLYQEPNNRFLGLFRLNLGWYNLSGRDTTKFFNRMLRKMGEPPVVYEPSLVERSRFSIKRHLTSIGYFNAIVDTAVRYRKGKVRVTYTLHGKQPYTVHSYAFEGSSDSISLYLAATVNGSLLKPGVLLNSQLFDEERARIVRILQRQGFFAINKEHLYFKLDSTRGNFTADVRLSLRPWQPDTTSQTETSVILPENMHPVYRVNKIYFMMDVPMSSYIRLGTQQDENGVSATFDVADYDTLSNGPYQIVYRGKPFVNPETLIQNCRIEPSKVYDIVSVERTYSRLNSLQLIKYVNIRFREKPGTQGRERLIDCYIVLTPNKKQRFTVDVEGTNTSGDMGVAGNLSFSHRNVFNGAEMLQANFRGAYEALSANFSNDYTELGGELSLVLPDFKIPLLNADFKRRVDANTELALSYQNMSRPEFLRNIASGAVRYNWSKGMLRQTFDLADLSYVYMARVDSAFKARYLSSGSYLKYSYEDHLILRSAYSFSYSSANPGVTNRSYYTVRGSVESAGNSLYGLFSLAGIKKVNDYYVIGNINFSQYLKGEIEYAKSIVLNSKNRFAYRGGLGLAYPYGNSRILPFEKRFFSGGANSVRGWSVRTLGPGHYASGSSDFMNQSGDMKLDLGAEYRSLLFWKLESALFADVGNIWTLRNYDTQPGGQFRFSTFLQDLAGSVGVGLRADFSYFLFRVDLGMKVYDPSLSGGDRWRIRSIDKLDDFALHVAIGYPF